MEREIPGFPGYFATADGRILSAQRPGLMYEKRQRIGTKGYPTVRLVRGRQVKLTRDVHRLVALAFLGPPPPDRPEVRHLDGEPTHNRIDNLAWGNREEQQRDMLRHGTRPITTWEDARRAARTFRPSSRLAAHLEGAAAAALGLGAPVSLVAKAIGITADNLYRKHLIGGAQWREVVRRRRIDNAARATHARWGSARARA